MNTQISEATNLVELVDGQAFTSSLSIAEHSGNEHRGVIQLVRQYLPEFDDFGRVKFEIRPFQTAGGMQSREVALLNEPQATLLLTYMRNSEVVRKFKRALVRAFTEMRARVAPDVTAFLNDPASLRTLLGNYADRVIALEHTVEEQKPKVMALDRISTANAAMSVTEAAKVLQMQPRALFEWLQKNNWTYRRTPAGPWLGRQCRLDQSLLAQKLVHRGEREDGSARVYDQVLVTAKGLAKLAELIERAIASPSTARAIEACSTLLN